MNLGQLRTVFLRTLNRDDCTETEADDFLALGLRRVTRRLRVPFMERLLQVSPSSGAVATIDVPADYVEQIELLVDDKPLRRVSHRELLRAPTSGPPTVYSRFGGNIHIRGFVPQGSVISLLYYGELPPLGSDDAANELTIAAPDLLIYAGLLFAGDHFQSDRLPSWTVTFETLLAETNEQARQDEASGGPMAVAPIYTFPEDT